MCDARWLIFNILLESGFDEGGNMRFLDGLFRRKTAAKTVEKAKTASLETQQLLLCSAFIAQLLNRNAYVARSEYASQLQDYQEVIKFFQVLQKSKTLPFYCRENGIAESMVCTVLQQYDTMEDLIEAHNEQFIASAMQQEKSYLDRILHDVDPNITLDDDQRRVVLTDEDYCLVIAGAGAGKTTTVAAKVKYLVEKKGMDPSQILLVSFTNKAVGELREKINTDLGIPCQIATFHSVGNAIIHKNAPDEKLSIVDDAKLYFVTRDYFRNSVLKDENAVNKLILFFASYFDAPYEGSDLNDFFNNIAKANYSTMRSDLEDYKLEIIDSRTKKSVTIQNEILRSHQEVEIANFLYLNNIDYEYEPIYPYDIPGSRKPYTPDFIIRQNGHTAYIEHFGINEDHTNIRYSRDQLDAYKKAVHDKILLHRQHQTTLLYTFSGYKDRRTLTEHLRELLESNGFVLKPRSNREIMEKLVAGETNRYIRKLVNLICRFISNFKVNGFTAEEFRRMYYSTQNVRTRLFLDICNDCFLEYERFLKKNNAVDFQDMINESARLLRQVKEMKQKLDFKYIIVDEYQDISRQRFDLTKALAEVTDAKIIAVGDDWQSIYAFSGSDISLFTKFEEKMGYARLLKIVKTYRNSQEVIDIAGGFIQQNAEQITKELQSPKSITDPVIIYTYDAALKRKNDHRRAGANYALSYAVETALGQIREYCSQEGKEPGRVLLLGRFGFDGDNLERSGLFEYIKRGSRLKSVRYPKMDITFMTAHASKGLGYDNVIVVNGKNETYGFPSKIQFDPVLSFVIRGDRSIDYAEERRLFYVAMTRTKNRVYFIAPEQNPSEFLLEIKHNYKNVLLKGKWNEDTPQQLAIKSCPICGYPLQLRYKNAYGLRLYICTNEPELCGFMTNEYKAGKMSILKCSRCRDGYLVIKSGKGENYFLGCTNYKRDGSGCNHTIGKKQYYEMMCCEPEPEAAPLAEIPSAASAAVQPAAPKQKPAFVPNKSEGADVIQKPDLTPVRFKGIDLNEVLFTMLQALENVSARRFYGINMLLDVLRGSDTKRLLEAELNLVPEYGTLAEIPRETLFEIIVWMLDHHFMLKTKGQYPVLHPTADGKSYHKTITTAKLNTLKRRLETGV